MAARIHHFAIHTHKPFTDAVCYLFPSSLIDSFLFAPFWFFGFRSPITYN